jgi:ABC-2 type transport system permease protein
MDAFLQQLRITLRLHFRNRMAILYSYLFPTIFLIAFWVLYRYERVPLARHMGELLTVTALGGACFGLPTTMVSERERGVWRRYRLAPIATGTLLASTVLARYVLLVLAGVLQVGLAMLVGMPLPEHPFELWLAFTCVSFALLGLGLVIATLADNVPAVQALGQCIFLPMLIIGGVAVQLASLPPWAQHVSAFFPGRYAVEAMQACVTGEGIDSVRFSLLALLLIGAAGSLAGIKMFRWDAQQRFATRPGKAWIAVALAAWVAVGLMAEARGIVAVGETATRTLDTALPPPLVEPAAPSLSSAERAATSTIPPSTAPAEPAPPQRAPVPARPAPDTSEAGPGTGRAGREGAPAAGVTAPDARAAAPPPAAAEPAPARPAPSTAPTPSSEPSPATSPPPEPATWRDVTPAHIEQVVFSRLPNDAGVVSPIAPIDEPLDPDLEAEVEEVRSRLPAWGPGQVADPVQKVRNYLYVAAVPDVFQLPVERHVPHVVFERIKADVPQEDLIKILFWIATHPSGGDDSAVDDLRSAGLRTGGPMDIEQTRERVMLYALKLLGRVTGNIPE